MTSQQIHKMVLHPRSANFALSSWDDLITHLQEMEFLDSPLNDSNQNRFLVGERFLQYMTFMGCSPSVELTPPKDGSLDFCHVQFSEISPEVRFRCASQNVFSRCPHCRKRINNWTQAVSLWAKDSSALVFNCDKCGEQVSLYQLGWRHTAGFARMFIDIYSIYPQEVIPTDPFLSLLETKTGEQWEYFYTDQ